jgi:hypothetical protein
VGRSDAGISFVTTRENTGNSTGSPTGYLSIFSFWSLCGHNTRFAASCGCNLFRRDSQSHGGEEVPSTRLGVREPNSETTQTARVKWGIAERAGELLASVETLNEPWAVVEGIGHQGAPGDAVLAAPMKADTLKPASLMVTAADRLTSPDKRKSGPNRTLRLGLIAIGLVVIAGLVGFGSAVVVLNRHLTTGYGRKCDCTVLHVVALPISAFFVRTRGFWHSNQQSMALSPAYSAHRRANIIGSAKRNRSI